MAKRVPEIRTDPLGGHRTIVAGERSRRPGGAGLRAAGVDRPRADPFAEGHEDRTPPELYAVRPRAGPPTRPAGRCASSPTSIPRSLRGSAGAVQARGAPGTRRRGRAQLFVALPATGAHEVIVNGPQPVLSLAELPVAQVVAAVEAWRERMRAHADSAYVQLIVNERREAGASLPHTHAQLYALDFVPADRRARARALRRLHDAHDGPEPARRPRRRGGTPARADRRDRRRGGADGPLRLAPALPADARAAEAARALRGRRARPAPHCCTTASAGSHATSARARR